MRNRIEASVVGLDLSLRGTAACALPIDWDQNLMRVRMMRAGKDLKKDATPEDRIDRIIQIKHDVVTFLINRKAAHVGIEEYAFAQGRQSHARELAELGGHVKAGIRDELDHIVLPVVASQARKILLQHVPRNDAKAYVSRNVKRLGGPTEHWTDDEIDAFTIANYMLMLHGGVAMTFRGE